MLSDTPLPKGDLLSTKSGVLHDFTTTLLAMDKDADGTIDQDDTPKNTEAELQALKQSALQKLTGTGAEELLRDAKSVDYSVTNKRRLRLTFRDDQLRFNLPKPPVAA